MIQRLAALLARLPNRAASPMAWARRLGARRHPAEAWLTEVFRQFPGTAAILEAPSGRLVLRSQQSADMLQRPDTPGLQAVGGLAAYGGVHDDGTPFAAADYPIARALAHGEIVTGEVIRYRRPDGSEIFLEVHAGPVRAPDGTQLAAVGMAFDITEKIQAQLRLRDSEAAARRTAEQLRQALAERDVLMHEADHRIKNSLQLVTSLLHLQMGKLTDPDARAALEAAVTRVNAVGTAHLALQQSPDLRRIDVAAMLADLASRMGLLNPALTLSIDTGDAEIWLDAEQAIPLGLIASEALTNALRHAYAPGAAGEVMLTARLGMGTLDVVVADQGAGLPPAPRRAGLGTLVVQTLARQIGATIIVHSQAGQGTRLTVSLRLARVQPSIEVMVGSGGIF